MIDVSIGNDVTMRGGNAASVGRIDQYELLRELGGGGFGCVYLAKDTVAGIEVAVKGLPPEVRHNKEELENIRANFALVSRLHHPNIAAALVLHPAVKAEYSSRDGMEKLRVFERDTMMVMEYAPGVTLSQWRKQFPDKKVPLEKALDITRQVAAALDYAHGEKIVHRDVKPSNVMIETKLDGSVVARVLDFGLAAEIRSSMGRVSREIRDTSGTRPYMAPEQWRGAKQGPATDQYALAAMFCELVTGAVPFASVFDTGDPVVMLTNVTTLPPELPEGLPRGCRKTLLRALAKKPEERFTSCEAFADALSSGGRARTPRLAPASQLASLGGYPSAPMLWRISIVVLLALAAVGGWWWRERVRSEELRVKNEALAAERARQEEAKRLEEEKRLAAAKQAEEARIAAEKAEAERKAKLEADRLAAEKAEAERKAKLEAERKAKAEAERVAAEKAEAERREKLEAERIAEEKRRAAEAAKPVPQKMLEALGAMGLDFAKCERDEYAALGIPLMTEILSCYRDYTALFEERKKLLDSLTEKHPDIIAFGPRIDRAKKNLTETIAQSAGLVEKYADRYDCDLQKAVGALKDDVLAYEFFERKLPVSLKLKLRGAYSDYLSAVRKRRELLKTFTEAHPDVVAADALVRKAEESFKSDVRAFMVSQGWMEEKTVEGVVSSPSEQPTDDSDHMTYVVQSGDYLAKISKKFDVTIGMIKRLNPQLKNDVIKVGMSLTIPRKGGHGERSMNSDKTDEGDVKREKQQPNGLTDEMRAKMRARREQFMAKREAERTERALEIVKEYISDVEVAKRLLGEVSSCVKGIRFDETSKTTEDQSNTSIVERRRKFMDERNRKKSAAALEVVKKYISDDAKSHELVKRLMELKIGRNSRVLDEQ